MRVLAIASAHAIEVGLFESGRELAVARAAGPRGAGGSLATMVTDILMGRPPPDGVAVIVGPGSFTGLRAGLAVAIGLGLGAGIPVAGVGVAEALAAAAGAPDGRTLWIALHSGRPHVFLDTGAGMRAMAASDVPRPVSPVAIAGDAAIVIAATLAARGADVRLTDARVVRAADVAAVGARRLAGDLPPLAPAPLYVDPPAVT